MGHYFKSEKVLIRTPMLLTASSLLFFSVVNFGVWLTNPLYPKTLSGLYLCYVAAIPFVANQLLGDLAYGLILFAGFAMAEKLIPAIRKPVPSVQGP